MIRVLTAERSELPLRTRMPFRYGIAALTEAPYAVLRAEVEVDGRVVVGWAADLLPPKWFTKDPQSPFEEDLAEMRRVIDRACREAAALPAQPTLFRLWRALYEAQGAWAGQEGLPPLLWHFGVSLVERAAIDAVCRADGLPFHEALRSGRLGIEPGEVHPALGGQGVASLLPAAPLRSVAVRHTVGLSDPLRDEDIPAGERLDDGLPQSLEASIRAYGLTHFKIKLCGDAGRDLPRLRELASLLQATVGDGYRHTLDGNEQYAGVEAFRALWEAMRREPGLAPFLDRLIFVEQPFPRAIALGDGVGESLRRWTDRPPIVIDESDGDLAALPRALSLGYVGTSHKNCKGVCKGVLNACLLEAQRRAAPERPRLLSGEDLANVGPLALLQDLAVAASLGVGHVERNGHHYFRGLSAMPAAVQRGVLTHHADLYRRHEAGFPTLRIAAGRIAIGSVVDAPFGYAGDGVPLPS